MKANIAEIFKSIQGEGIHQGVTQVFVRFFGCNLQCAYCDTKLEFFKEKIVDEVIDEIDRLGQCHSVSLTGGEPLLQADFVRELSRRLKLKRYKVYLETNGTLPAQLAEVLDDIDFIAMDFKLHTSTGLRCFFKEHREFLRLALKKEVFIKTVVSKNTQVGDLLGAVEIVKEFHPQIAFVLQPDSNVEDEIGNKLMLFKTMCEFCGINVKVLSQIHKELGVK